MNTLDGRTTPPSDAELHDAEATGGLWIGTLPRPITLSNGPHPRMIMVIRGVGHDQGYALSGGDCASRWFYIAPDGRITTPGGDPAPVDPDTLRQYAEGVDMGYGMSGWENEVQRLATELLVARTTIAAHVQRLHGIDDAATEYRDAHTAESEAESAWAETRRQWQVEGDTPDAIARMNAAGAIANAANTRAREAVTRLATALGVPPWRTRGPIFGLEAHPLPRGGCCP